jgi:hypothetical protein
MVLQNYTDSESVLAGPYGETYPACHNADQAMNIKVEVTGAEEEEDPLPITHQEIKAKIEVSCMSVCQLLGRYHKFAEMPVVFLIFICLSVHMKELHCVD